MCGKPSHFVKISQTNRPCRRWSRTYKEKSAANLNLMMACFGFGSCLAPFYVAGSAYIVSRYMHASAPEQDHLTIQLVFFGIAFLCFLAICLNILIYIVLYCRSFPTPGVNDPAYSRLDREDSNHRVKVTISGGATVKNIPPTIAKVTDRPLRTPVNDQSASTRDYSLQDSSLCTSKPLFFFLVVDLYVVFSVGVEGTVGSWLFTLAGGSSSDNWMSLAVLTNSAFWGSFTIARLVMIKLSDRVPLKLILYGSHIVSFISLLPPFIFYTIKGSSCKIPTSAIWVVRNLFVCFSLCHDKSLL